MKSLPIKWQRLVDSAGKTCVRCDATHRELQRATGRLRDVLRPLGIEPTLEVREIDTGAFKDNPSESNRIWIAGKSLEDWLGANIGSSRCCSVCGESDCRTVEIGTTRFEIVPETLILKAALVAASEMLSEIPSETPSPPPVRT